MKTIYIDTNIYLDYLLGRKNQFDKPLGPDALTLFHRAIGCEFKIIVSSKILEELYGNCSIDETRMLFAFLKKKLQIVKVTKEEVSQAKSMCVGAPYQDALHAILANKYKAEYLITRNMIHFNQYRSLIEPKYPSDI